MIKIYSIIAFIFSAIISIYFFDCNIKSTIFLTIGYITGYLIRVFQNLKISEL